MNVFFTPVALGIALFSAQNEGPQSNRRPKSLALCVVGMLFAVLLFFVVNIVASRTPWLKRLAIRLQRIISSNSYDSKYDR
jgi:hypothetical protein